METKRLPYELLFRWDDEGRVSGAHVAWRYVTMDGKTKVGEFVSDPIPVGMNKRADGFPLSDVLSEAQASMAAELGARAAEIERLLNAAEESR